MTELDNIGSLHNTLLADLYKQWNCIIEDAFVKNGFSFCSEFIQENISIVEAPGDTFSHYYFRYGKPDEKRIISIEKEFKIDWLTDDESKVKVKAERRYY